MIKNLDESEKWKLIVDGEDHDKGPDVYDKPRDYVFYRNGKPCDAHNDGEPGYRVSMVEAFKFALENIDRKFDHVFYKELHSKACVKVQSIRENFRISNVHFGLTHGNFSNAGKREFDAKSKSLWKSDHLFWHDDEGCSKRVGNLGKSGIFKKWRYEAPSVDSEEDIIEAVNIIFQDYYDKLEELKENGWVQGALLSRSASLEDKILEIIVRTCHNLDLLHAFSDGNIRTIAFLVLQIMLIQNDLLPTIFYNPNCLDFKSTPEIITKLKRG